MNLKVSRKAEKFIRRMITFSGKAGGFRLAVKEGGCSGMSYDFSIEAEPAATDAVVTTETGLQVFVPAECQAMLDGIVIECEDSLMNTGLTFFNPNAAKSCGCGTSFTPAA
ncbi:MAG: iron-sulfur cluster assembly accessory protein [Proteobacteria bacterium]|nr:iron-sulfur cluster assembly accessory protein [Pseudomonadota bacterium]MBS0600688.1 iron-sulfur cluster assembly accessory protein [Pseudomonadota bacterium]